MNALGPVPRLQADVGQRLVYEQVEQRVRKERSDGDPDWWCNDQALLWRSLADVTLKLDCYGMPTHAPIRVERSELIPSDSAEEPLVNSTTNGQGFRMWIEVLDYGTLVLGPNQACGLGKVDVLAIEE